MRLSRGKYVAQLAQVDALPALGVARVEPQSVKAGSCETASLRFARGCERPRGSPTHYCSGRKAVVSCVEPGAHVGDARFSPRRASVRVQRGHLLSLAKR